MNPLLLKPPGLNIGGLAAGEAINEILRQLILKYQPEQAGKTSKTN